MKFQEKWQVFTFIFHFVGRDAFIVAFIRQLLTR